MKSVLERLWEEYVYPTEMCLISTPEEKELTSRITRYHESLMATLTEEQQILFEEYVDGEGKLLDIREREIFAYAFRLGAQTILECTQPIGEE